MAAIPVSYLVAASLAGTAVTAYSAIQQGDTARKAAHTRADQDRLNAEEVSRQATGQIEQQRSNARRVIGQQLASTSESGTGLSGSNLDLLNQSLANNQADSLSLRYSANRNAAGLNAQADINDFQASESQTGSYLSATGTLVNGLTAAGTLLNAPRGASYLQRGSLLPSN